MNTKTQNKRLGVRVGLLLRRSLKEALFKIRGVLLQGFIVMLLNSAAPMIKNNHMSYARIAMVIILPSGLSVLLVSKSKHRS